MSGVIRRTLFAALAVLLLLGMLAPSGLASAWTGNGGKTIDFERYTGGSREWAVVTAYDRNGNAAWEYTTDVYDIAEVNRVAGVGTCNGLYYLVEDGTVIALDAATGSVRWKNGGFLGAVGASVFGDEGELYLCGYFGPDLFIVDAEGDTVDRIDTINGEYMWPYEIQYLGDGLAITYESGPSGGSETLYVNGDYYIHPSDDLHTAWGEAVGMALPADAISSVTATSHLEEPQYGFSHTADNLIDGTLANAWVEGISGQGEGESVTLWLSGAYRVSGFTINAGYQKSESTYNNNSRPAVLEATFSDGTELDITLRDYNGQQVVEFPYPVSTSSIRLTIRSVYPGTTYQDTVISEIALF